MNLARSYCTPDVWARLDAGLISSARPSPSDSSRKNLRHEVLKPPQSSPDEPEPSPTSPTSSSSAPTTVHRGQPASAVYFDDIQHCKHRHPPLLLTRALIRWFRP